jgi:hypothetical protein
MEHGHMFQILYLLYLLYKQAVLDAEDFLEKKMFQKSPQKLEGTKLYFGLFSEKSSVQKCFGLFSEKSSVQKCFGLFSEKSSASDTPVHLTHQPTRDSCI